MEIRAFAERILLSPSLALKLERLSGPITDRTPGQSVQFERPERPANLQFAPRRTAPAMPRPAALHHPEKRAVAHHIMANHELQALEVMAWVLCAFPQAPPEFRQGLVDVMHDEQRHTRLHTQRAASLGMAFGDLPVNSYIWTKAMAYRSVLDYLAGLPLTFENRNLDHTLEFDNYFRDAGDDESAAIMRAIHRDEIRHVRFGLEWFRRLKPSEATEWETFCNHLNWPIRPAKARGDIFHREPRLAAGMTETFIDQLQNVADEEE